MIQYRKDKHNIVTLTLDMKGRRVNILNHKIAPALIPVWKRLVKDKEKQALRGVIITSAKPSFLAGGDLDYLHSATDAEDVFRLTGVTRTIFRNIETLGAPVVAAMNGAALGSGFELALACHYRIAVDDPKTIFGLPEITLGMMPMGGGVSRLNWMFGIVKAFDIISSGKNYHIQEAKKLGLIDEIVENRKDLILRAREWILANPTACKPWDKPDAEIPALSDPRNTKTARKITQLTAMLIERTWGNSPAQQAILNALSEGAVVDFDSAAKIESRYFTALIRGTNCMNLTKAFWYDLNRIKNGASRPKGFGRFRARQIGIIGAGKMGSGIAYVAAMEGIEVILKDISVTIAEQGKAYAERQLIKLVKSQKMTRQQADCILNRIKTTEKSEDFSDCDLIIESVFENENIKARVIRDAEMYLHRDAFILSNTSSLSISKLSEVCSRPSNYIGMQFFSSVQTCPLVEILHGRNSSQETLARAFDFARQIRKIPVIAKDYPGFYTLRVSRMYRFEGIALIQEGQSAITIENAALRSGMVHGPLALADRRSLENLLQIQKVQLANTNLVQPSTEAIQSLDRIVNDFGRYGKARGKGFYNYDKRKNKLKLWEGLSEHFSKGNTLYTQQEITDRLIFIQCIESARCLEQGIIESSADANLGSIHGWGFIPFKGGTIQYINDYGIDTFVKRADELADKYGERFRVPALLRKMVKDQVNFL
ncbi:MAG: 3-hydroxyacyl-CoA dehydrogenase NAD-binding domain-containing protein [Saprospiraceae bacterium]|nr:3-hydroxyacyl-CoA dehydrogenase NAD-binding domain-containing protein [Saprospiraceae bacterium]